MCATRTSIRPRSQRVAPLPGLYLALTLCVTPCVGASASPSQVAGVGLSQPTPGSGLAVAGLRFLIPFPEATRSALEALFGNQDALIGLETRAWAFPTRAARLGLLAARRAPLTADARLNREIDAEIRATEELRRASARALGSRRTGCCRPAATGGVRPGQPNARARSESER